MATTIDELPFAPFASPLGHMAAFADDRLPFLRALGHVAPLVRARFLQRTVLFPTTPELAHEVLVERAKSFEKSPGLRIMLHSLAGEGLFTSEGDLWRRQRRLMAPLFHPAQLATYASVMNECAQRAVASWRDGDRLELLREMTRVTMSVVAKTLFGADTFSASDEIGAALTTLLQWVDDVAASPLLVLQIELFEALERAEQRAPAALAREIAWLRQLSRRPVLLRGNASPEVREAVALLDARLAQMIAERRASGLTRDDLLTKLLSARDAEGGSGGMSDKQVRDEAATLFVAGHETTATALAWCFYLLARHPAARARVQAEADAFGPSGPTFHDADRLVYTTQVFKEALRLYPPLLIYPRRSVERTSVGGVDLPRGSLVFVSPYTIHTRPDVWNDPDRFDPDRFTRAAEEHRHRGAFLPFGAGPRVCIGAHFALMEGAMVLTTLMRQASFDIDASREIKPTPFATLRPGGGVPAVVRLGAGRAAA